MNELDVDKFFSDLVATSEARAQRLATEGRNLKEVSIGSGLFNDNLIRWVFWKLHRENNCAFDKSRSEDALLVEAIEECISNVREDERKRVAAIAAKGLQVLLGEEARNLISYIADAMDLE